MVEAEHGIQFQGVQTKAQTLKVSGKVGFDGHPMLDHFRFLKSVATVTPKMTIPSPSVLHFRGGRQAISNDVYPDMDAFYADTAEAYRKAVTAFYDAGCRYLQLDDTVWAYLCSEKEKQAVRDRGEDPDALPGIYRDMINHAIKDRPARPDRHHACLPRQFPLHLDLRGRLRAGRRDPARQTDYDGYFLEYDTDRAGGFEPLRFLPQAATSASCSAWSRRRPATSRTRARSSGASRRRRSSPPLDQFCLSPQCGFASTEEGNILTEEAQWKKLGLIVAIAKEVWGEV